jgi:hypothetical protein
MNAQQQYECEWSPPMSDEGGGGEIIVQSAIGDSLLFVEGAFHRDLRIER